jgi:hypothetical protein
MKDICRACDKSHSFCCFRLAELEEKCPCIECLVKVICIEECRKRLLLRYDLMEGKTVGEFIRAHSKEYGESMK